MSQRLWDLPIHLYILTVKIFLFDKFRSLTSKCQKQKMQKRF
ncbi:11148_t:CDS:2 [Diversispora eburnea]|uniref:11148_t:CDS:1 n=1 Tax=Diversispora eburnea TaxID=1213867 RepID=A0A9N8VB30_9GLOM|nr:11148_t:CDS:2 [Diversispora eburnea]